jgi:anti-sigma B factor antagonist
MELNLESWESGEVVVVHCRGRMVYREEAAAVSRVVEQALRHSREVVLDLAQVENIDSAGLGELVVAHMSAAEQGKTVKIVGANRWVRDLFDLTNLSSIFEIYPNMASAIDPVDGWVSAI